VEAALAYAEAIPGEMAAEEAQQERALLDLLVAR